MVVVLALLYNPVYCVKIGEDGSRHFTSLALNLMALRNPDEYYMCNWCGKKSTSSLTCDECNGDISIVAKEGTPFYKCTRCSKDLLKNEECSRCHNKTVNKRHPIQIIWMLIPDAIRRIDSNKRRRCLTTSAKGRLILQKADLDKNRLSPKPYKACMSLGNISRTVSDMTNQTNSSQSIGIPSGFFYGAKNPMGELNIRIPEINILPCQSPELFNPYDLYSEDIQRKAYSPTRRPGLKRNDAFRSRINPYNIADRRKSTNKVVPISCLFSPTDSESEQSSCISTSVLESVAVPTVSPKHKEISVYDLVTSGDDTIRPKPRRSTGKRLLAFQSRFDAQAKSIVTEDDYRTLDPGVWLNDAIIDFYLKYLWEEMLTEADRKRTFVLSLYFLEMLCLWQRSDRAAITKEERYSTVKKWTQGVDLFAMDYIVMPICHGFHWYLFIVCYPGTLTPEYYNGDREITKAEFMHLKEQSKPWNTAKPLTGQPMNQQSDVGNTATPSNPVIDVPSRTCISETGLFGGGGTPDSTERKVNAKALNEAGDWFGQQEVEPSVSGGSGIEQPRLWSKESCILSFDSGHGGNKLEISGHIRDFFNLAWKESKNTDRTFDKLSFPIKYPTVPRQFNSDDCGVFLLQYVEQFFKTPIDDLAADKILLPNWFSDRVVIEKRGDIQRLIRTLADRSDKGSQPGSGSHVNPGYS